MRDLALRDRARGSGFEGSGAFQYLGLELLTTHIQTPCPLATTCPRLSRFPDHAQEKLDGAYRVVARGPAKLADWSLPSFSSDRTLSFHCSPFGIFLAPEDPEARVETLGASRDRRVRRPEEESVSGSEASVREKRLFDRVLDGNAFCFRCFHRLDDRIPLCGHEA
jgi:hypothetical protein